MTQPTSEALSDGKRLIAHLRSSMATDPHWTALSPYELRTVLDSLDQALARCELAEARLAALDDEDHFVTFDAHGWFVEHTLSCREAGTLGTCKWGNAIRLITAEMDEPDPDDLGRWRITDVDSEGLPSLERAAQPEPDTGGV